MHRAQMRTGVMVIRVDWRMGSDSIIGEGEGESGSLAAAGLWAYRAAGAASARPLTG